MTKHMKPFPVFTPGKIQTYGQQTYRFVVNGIF